ncbi:MULTISPECIES: LPXTG cell wall anchor domain-containing protein [Enterococcus]|nr:MULTISPECIES: LPXTG cell wall anchor domain-containing protein [Enterococcus]MDT6341179.1 LPXTG cell wall anchor domain-containing protein [Enterococcus faecium]GMS55348.1 hypothetical protein NUITMVRE36_23400 [Enterococcus raffinosus]
MKSKIILGGLLLSTATLVSLQSPQITSAESLTNSAEIIVPLNLKVKAHYTNGLPLEAGKEVRLRNLTDGSTEVLKKQVDANGEVTFTEQDGIKKEVNYSIETDGVRNGYTVRYDLGGEKEKDITVNLPGAELPLSLKVKAHYTNGLPLEAGKAVRLRNLTDGSTEVLKKQVDANGEVTFTEQDGIKKEVNYGIETDGVRNGYTVRYDLGGEKEKDITVNLPGAELPLSLKVKAHYTNGLPLEAGKAVRLRNLTDGSTEVLKKQVDANGEVTFTEQDGIKKEVNYGIETDGVRNGYTVRYDLGGEKEKDITVNLPGAELPLSLKVKAHYTNGLPLEAGKEVRLRNLTDGSTEVLKKQVDANGEVTFTEQDGIKKEVNYSIETDGVRNGYTVRYDLGGEKEKDITVNLPGAELPLSLKVKAHYTNGLPLEAGKEVRLRNLTDGSTEVLKKQVDANGEVTFTEQDGIKKEVNYSIETDGVRNGYTVRYDLGGEKEKDIAVNLPEVTKNTNSKQSSGGKASDKQANFNHPSTFFNNNKKSSNLNYNNSNEKRELMNQEKKKEGNRNKNTMELPKTGEKYNGLPVYVGLFTAIASIIGLKKNKF